MLKTLTAGLILSTLAVGAIGAGAASIEPVMMGKTVRSSGVETNLAP